MVFHGVRFLSIVLLKFLALPVTAFLLMSCQPVLLETESNALELGETAVDSAFFFGFSMDYPTGWHFIPCYPGFKISEEEEETGSCDREGPVIGDVVELDHRSMYLMHRLGLPEEPTLEDLLRFMTEHFELQDPQVSEVAVYGVPALRIRAETPDGAAIAYTGFLENEVFLLTFLSADETTLDAFMPTIEVMVASIRPVEE